MALFLPSDVFVHPGLVTGPDRSHHRTISMQQDVRTPGRRASAWRGFDSRSAKAIDTQLREGRRPCCPLCRELLQARPVTRMTRYLVLDASGYDLECRTCRRFRSVIRHTARSLRLVRMRRLAAAVHAMGTREPALA
jgi:hypothetical protein